MTSDPGAGWAIAVPSAPGSVGPATASGSQWATSRALGWSRDDRRVDQLIRQLRRVERLDPGDGTVVRDPDRQVETAPAMTVSAGVTP